MCYIKFAECLEIYDYPEEDLVNCSQIGLVNCSHILASVAQDKGCDLVTPTSSILSVFRLNLPETFPGYLLSTNSC